MVESIKELRRICGSRKKQPLYMELVSMKVSMYITKLYLYTRLSADYVTMSMIALVILGSVLMAFGNVWLIFYGILIVHFTIILDNVNGEVARYWKEDGLIGTFLEQVYHNLSIPFLFFSLALGVFISTANILVLVFGFLCSLFGLPVIQKSIKDAVVDERMAEKDKVKRASIGHIDIKGGSSKSGRALYKLYDKFRAIWVFPAPIVHISVLAILEVANLRYAFMPQFASLTWYTYTYGAISVFVQAAAFVVNYRGKTVYHYYEALFHKK